MCGVCGLFSKTAHIFYNYWPDLCVVCVDVLGYEEKIRDILKYGIKESKQLHSWYVLDLFWIDKYFFTELVYDMWVKFGQCPDEIFNIWSKLCVVCVAYSARLLIFFSNFRPDLCVVFVAYQARLILSFSNYWPVMCVACVGVLGYEEKNRDILKYGIKESKLIHA